MCHNSAVPCHFVVNIAKMWIVQLRSELFCAVFVLFVIFMFGFVYFYILLTFVCNKSDSSVLSF